MDAVQVGPLPTLARVAVDGQIFRFWLYEVPCPADSWTYIIATTAGHSAYYAPIAEPVRYAYVQKMCSLTDIAFHADIAVVSTEEWLRFVRLHSRIRVRLQIRAWIFTIYECGITTVQWDPKAVRSDVPKFCGRQDEVVINPDFLFTAGRVLPIENGTGSRPFRAGHTQNTLLC